MSGVNRRNVVTRGIGNKRLQDKINQSGTKSYCMHKLSSRQMVWLLVGGPILQTVVSDGC